MQFLPSGPTPAEPGQAGLVLAPFRGVRYAEGRVSGLAEVTSPPYDVIARDNEQQLMAADPHNVVRLIMPHAAAGADERYRTAALALDAWLDEGILIRDPEPALYVYEQAGPGCLQRGLIGALRLVPPDAGIVLPHEDVAPGPVAGRRELMAATRANLEPIFLLHDGGPDPGPATRIADQVASTARPLTQADTADGLRHRLWAITDPAGLAAIATDLAPRTALIADGHHRYAAYLDLQQRRHRSGYGPGPWDLGLALLVDSAAYPPEVGAIYRVVHGLGPAEAARLAAKAFSVRELPWRFGQAGLDRALAALAAAAASGPAFLLAGQHGAYLLTDPDPGQAADAMPPGHSAAWTALPAAILQELLIGRLWGITDGHESIELVHDDAAAALRAADAVPAGTAVVSCPLTAAQVRAVAAAGEKVPRKSTSFRPKPRTGLIFRTFALS